MSALLKTYSSIKKRPAASCWRIRCHPNLVLTILLALQRNQRRKERIKGSCLNSEVSHRLIFHSLLFTTREQATPVLHFGTLTDHIYSFSSHDLAKAIAEHVSSVHLRCNKGWSATVFLYAPHFWMLQSNRSLLGGAILLSVCWHINLYEILI